MSKLRIVPDEIACRQAFQRIKVLAWLHHLVGFHTNLVASNGGVCISRDAECFHSLSGTSLI